MRGVRAISRLGRPCDCRLFVAGRRVSHESHWGGRNNNRREVATACVPEGVGRRWRWPGGGRPGPPWYSRSRLTAFPAGGGVRRPPRVLVLVPAAHGASGDRDTFVVTPGGAC